MAVSRRAVLLAAVSFWPLAGSRRAEAGVAPDRPADVEWHIWFFTNQQRISRRLTPFESSDALAAVARRHSRDMLVRRFFDHRSPDGLHPSDRIARAGLRFTVSSENIYRVKGGPADAAELASMMVRGWMKTRGHRANILDRNFRVLGVGVALGDRIALATQLFGG